MAAIAGSGVGGVSILVGFPISSQDSVPVVGRQPEILLERKALG